jgi:glycyl-tRNA synthetase
MNALTFQDIIMRLDAFWGSRGCLVTEPYDVEVGAGTNAPSTFLRVLGPEPWWVAYPQASRRPADGRYAQNPNRYQHYFQYQVILKPPPADPLGLYLESLHALGVDDREHDIRFVEDNWEAPSLGAWGLGWEVWQDGLEITQFTYFQQCGSLDLDPPSVEITYGLERIAMALQGVRDFVDIRWNDRVTYGELYRQSEIEHSTYNFELADVDALRTLFDVHEGEAKRTMEARLISPALEQILKCSHVFNVLDARGAVGVQQRANYLGRMRTLARRVAAAYVEQRAALGHPLAGTVRVEPPPRPPAEPPPDSDAERRADLLVELGVEELPAVDLSAALDRLRTTAPSTLEAAGLAHGPIEVSGTPRRLVVLVRDVIRREAAREELLKGPPAAAAYDADGNPTRAAEGFARSAGVEVGALEAREIGGRSYVVARRRLEARPTTEILVDWVAALFGGLRFSRPMYWESPDVLFSRPVRWLVALWGEAVVPASFAGVSAGRTTFPPRGLPQEPVRVASTADYAVELGERGVVLDPARRRDLILDRCRGLAAEAGGLVDEDPALLDEVANLVERPEPLLGSFDPRYLDAPAVALVTVMKKHQRYFPIYDREGRLLPRFIAVANGPRRDAALVRHGNEEVLRARFADALYFYHQDLRRPLADFVPDLAQLTFLERLGSMLDKTERLEALCGEVAGALGLAASGHLARAARLAKADLATSLVRELTELQGELGREYALRSGEPVEVAEGIVEQYLPRHAGDALPRSEIGIALGVTDRVDTLVCAFAAGLEPTGSTDPYALRRAALALIGVLIDQRNPASLERLVTVAAERSPLPLAGDRRAALLGFLRQRLRVLLIERGHRSETVDAVLAALADRPSLAERTVRALDAALETEGFQRLMAGVKRADRIIPKGQRFELDRAALREPADRALLEAYEAAARDVEGLAADDVEGLVRAMLPLTAPVDRFFADVLVMAEEPTLREARLALLQRIRDLPGRSFDVGALPAAVARVGASVSS